MRQTVFRDLHALYPDRIVNKTNGITFRRWLHQANPAPDRAPRRDGRRPRVLDDPDALGALERSRRRSRPSSERFAAQRRRQQGGAGALDRASASASRVDPDALFDVQIKRIHEYKRQLLNILETVALYHAIRAEPDARLGAAREDLRRQGGGELPRRRS